MSSLKNPNAPCLHVAHIRYTDDVQAWQVHCPRCRMSGPLKPTKVEAVNAWNSMSLAAQLMEAVEHKIQCEDAHHTVWHSGPVNGAAGNESAAALRDAIKHIDVLMFEVARHMRRQERDQEKEKEKDTRQSQEDAVLASIRAWNRLALAVQIADAGKRCEEELDGSRGPGNFRQELRRLLEQWEVDDEDDPDA